MWIQHVEDGGMSPALRNRVAEYRHHVFVQLLKWDLPCRDSYEQDEFDRPGAVHLVATDEDDAVVGYGRLLPTTGPYLLARHFADLLTRGGHALPCTSLVWELSRFTAARVADDGRQVDAETRTLVGKQVLKVAVQYVAERGCGDLLFCTTVAIERLAHRWGVEIQRLGPPQRSASGLLVAAQIRCSTQTLSALSVLH